MDTQKEISNSKHITLQVGGMGCGGCANTVKDALSNLDGVQEVNVDLTSDSASVRFDADAVSTDGFKKIIEEAGYELKGTE